MSPRQVGEGIANDFIRLNPTRAKQAVRKRKPRDRKEREGTVPLDDGPNWHLYEKSIELRYSRGSRLGCGFVFGTEEATCDILLPNLQGISGQHFTLTFEDKIKDLTTKWLVLRDFNTTSGTKVIYAKKNKDNTPDDQREGEDE
jgi:hypothetical protein